MSDDWGEWEAEDDEADLWEAEAEESEWVAASDHEGGHQRSLALGLVAIAPLLLAYEAALASQPGLHRNLAELALFRALAPLGDAVSLLRPALEATMVLLALVLCFRRRVALVPSVGRILLEGALAAVALGPLLALSMRLFEGHPPGLGAAGPAATPELAVAGRLAGGAAYEELLFRVLAYGAVFMLARRVALFFGSGERAAAWAADGAAVLLTSLAFAALHLERVALHLGPGGEAYDPYVFLWRLLAGILLALLFRWRGLGVAAWCHAFFNLALLLGAGAEVLT